MTFWNGTGWVDERAPAPHGPQRSRLTDWSATLTALAVAALLIVPIAVANAGGADLTVSPSPVAVGASTTAVGQNLPGHTKLQLAIDGSPAGLPVITTDRLGSFSVVFVMPSVPDGLHQLGLYVVSSKRGRSSTSTLGAIAASTTLSVVSAPMASADPTTTASPGATSGSGATGSTTPGAPGGPTVGATATPPPASSAPVVPTPSPSPTASFMPDPTASGTASAAPSSSATPTATPTTPATPSPAATSNPTPAPTPDGTYYVSTSGNDANNGSAATPWRTIAKAVSAAPANATILVRAGTYSPFSVTRAHLDVEAYPGESPVVSGGTTGITITASDTVVRGLRVTGATGQGIWVDGATGVILSKLKVDHNTGHGIQIIRSGKVQVTDSTVVANKLSGIRELTGTTGGRYTGNTITDNGHDGQPYNGDGLLLEGSGAYVAGNSILRNGDNTMYEHGIYAAASAAGYVITGNTVRDNAASGIKASGQGTVSDNTISGSVRGIVFADDGGTVKVTGNSIDATTYAILVTSNCVISRYDSDYNTFALKTFGFDGALDLAGWRLKTGLDQHSS